MTLHAHITDPVLDLTGHPLTVANSRVIDTDEPHEYPGSELIATTVVLAETSAGVAAQEIEVRGTRDHVRALADGLSAAADVQPEQDPS